MHACFPVGLREELDAGLTLHTASGETKKIRCGQKRAMRRGDTRAWAREAVGQAHGSVGVWEGALTPVEAIEQPYKKLMECAKT